jgi:hypothetical protein
VSVKVWVENRLHERVRSVYVDTSGVLEELRNLRIEQRTLLGSIDMFSDTVFNPLQARWLAEELDLLADSDELSEAQRSLARELAIAATEVERTHGYLFFYGD